MKEMHLMGVAVNILIHWSDAAATVCFTVATTMYLSVALAGNKKHVATILGKHLESQWISTTAS